MSICCIAALTALAPIALTFVRESLKTERRRIPHKKNTARKRNSERQCSRKSQTAFSAKSFYIQQGVPDAPSGAALRLVNTVRL